VSGDDDNVHTLALAFRWASTRTVLVLSAGSGQGRFCGRVGLLLRCLDTQFSVLFCPLSILSSGYPISLARPLSLPSYMSCFLCHCIIEFVDWWQLAGYKRDWCGKQGNLNEHDLYSSNQSLPGT
jgi:hypothetical protein